MTFYTGNVPGIECMLWFYLSHGSDKWDKIRFVSSDENCGNTVWYARK